METLVIQVGDKVYAQKVNPFDSEPNKTSWVGKSYEPLQASIFNYPGETKKFRNHRHVLNPRTIKKTQEAFIVVMGQVSVDIYHEKTKAYLGSLTAKAGESIFVWEGFHEVSTQGETLAYEIKCGQFTTVYEDKEFFDGGDVIPTC